MRLSTAYSYEQAIKNLQSRQSDLSTAQKELTSLKRVNSASDDPTAAARAERALGIIARSDADKRAVDASRNAMTLAEAAMGNGVELFQQIRETLVAADNGSYSQGELDALNSKMIELRKQLLSVANSPDGTGGYVFSGKGSPAEPFKDTPGAGVTYTGIPGEVIAPSSEQVNLTMNGQKIWMEVSRTLPDDSTETFSAFGALDDIIAGIKAGQTPSEIVSTGIARMDRVLGQLSSARSEAGEMLNRLDGIQTRLADTKLAAQTEKSNAEDLDMIEAISDFQKKQTGYEAALQSYAAIQRLSLFQYIS